MVIGCGEDEGVGEQRDNAEEDRDGGRNRNGQRGIDLAVDKHRDRAFMIVIVGITMNGLVEGGAGRERGQKQDLQGQPRGQATGHETTEGGRRGGGTGFQQFKWATSVLQSVCNICVLNKSARAKSCRYFDNNES